ncbi:phage tail sheath C-terminal domain-containing protein [Tindallia californiensis]|uniref:Phage tail sheath protein n=1 Tax=Tindallia californiensis TaxID=159292 RepID=A0A1H3R167_9FIRM|nr:phage tail sheath C-terminal domain-containing protein [Tindallia californiensis]SDZ19336.1 Phage tail sheath protein [Tindallia californiensis]
MGLPEILIKFQSLAVSAIQRSERGIVALILKDDTKKDFDTKEYSIITDIDPDDWTEENKDYIEKAFLGVPNKIIVERIDEDATDYNEALQRLATKHWNWGAIPGIGESDVSTVATWLKTKRDNFDKVYKMVLPNNDGDHEGIVNFTTEDIKVGERVYTTAEYTARLAGVFAGLSLQRSSTYYKLNEVDSIKESEDPDQDIDDGKLILINDEGVKIGRGVNSLTTLDVTQGEDWKKIKIIEGHDLVKEDIRRTFNDEYVGRVNNSYDNQVLFISAVNAYLQTLEGEVLNPNVDNFVDVDIEAQRLAWEGIGTDTSEWDEQEIKNNTFQSKVFINGPMRFLDAMEDLYLKVNV